MAISPKDIGVDTAIKAGMLFVFLIGIFKVIS